MMYFDEITVYEDEPELNNVGIYCSACGTIDIIEFEYCDEMIDEDHITLKDGVVLCCENCGKEHVGKTVQFKLKDYYATVNIPKCPVCQSANLKKISIGSKLVAAGTFGIFAAPFTSKTYECMNCKYKF